MMHSPRTRTHSNTWAGDMAQRVLVTMSGEVAPRLSRIRTEKEIEANTSEDIRGQFMQCHYEC